VFVFKSLCDKKIKQPGLGCFTASVQWACMNSVQSSDAVFLITAFLSHQAEGGPLIVKNSSCFVEGARH